MGQIHSNYSTGNRKGKLAPLFRIKNLFSLQGQCPVVGADHGKLS